MKLRSIVLGSFVSAAMIMLFIVIISVLLYFTQMNDSAANICVYAGAALGVFAGAFVSAKTCGGRVLLNSMSVSVLCVIALIVISLIMNGRVNFNMHFWAMILGSVFAGFLGAVLGK